MLIAEFAQNKLKYNNERTKNKRLLTSHEKMTNIKLNCLSAFHIRNLKFSAGQLFHPLSQQLMRQALQQARYSYKFICIKYCRISE